MPAKNGDGGLGYTVFAQESVKRQPQILRCAQDDNPSGFGISGASESLSEAEEEVEVPGLPNVRHVGRVAVVVGDGVNGRVQVVAEV